MPEHIRSKLSNMACGRLLYLVHPEVETHDMPIPKNPTRMKCEVDRMTSY